MRNFMARIFVVGVLAGTFGFASAAPANLDQWFRTATQFDSSGNAAPIAKPDFLGGSRQKNCRWLYNEKLPGLHGGLWQFQRYDRKHHIGLAVATTDQCSSALFTAATPSVSVPDADLSNYRTMRGLKIGSPYSQVLSMYGPPKMRGGHFVARYTADIPDVTVSGKPTKDPEVITIVIDDGHISAITVYIDLGGLF